VLLLEITGKGFTVKPSLYILFSSRLTSILLFRHSRYIYDRLRGVMAEEMKSKIKEYLIRVDPVVQHAVPFGITFDKVTLLKRSIQTTILITFVDGVLTPIYLQSPLCRTELSGKELAEK
jgi:hypothetical protein